VAELVKDVAAEVADIDADVALVENPRGDDETLVDSFPVDTGRTTDVLGWSPDHDVESAVREALESAR